MQVSCTCVCMYVCMYLVILCIYIHIIVMINHFLLPYTCNYVAKLVVATKLWWIHICDLLSKNQYRLHSMHLIVILLADFITHWMTKIRGTNYTGTFCTSRVRIVKNIKYNLKMVSDVCRELNEVRKERLRQRWKCEKLRRERETIVKKDKQGFLNLCTPLGLLNHISVIVLYIDWLVKKEL